MRQADEIQNRIATIEVKDYKKAIEKAYLELCLEKPEDYLKHLWYQYDMRLRHEHWEVSEDEVIFDVLNWVLEE